MLCCALVEVLRGRERGVAGADYRAREREQEQNHKNNNNRRSSNIDFRVCGV